MKTWVYVTSILLVACAAGSEEPPVRVEVLLAKKAFEPGEEIPLAVKVSPTREAGIEVGDAFFDIWKGKLQVRSPGGELLGTIHSAPRRSSAPYRWLPATKERPLTNVFDLTWCFPPAQVRWLHTFSALGEYRVRYAGEIYARPPRAACEPWCGDVTSNEESFQLVAPSLQSVDRAIMVLSDRTSPRDKKLGAIQALAFSQAETATQALISAVADTNTAVCLAAIWELEKTRTPLAFQALVSASKGSNKLVRANAVAAIGRYSTKEAMNRVIEEYESGSCWLTAANILLERGDASALPVLEKIAQNDPSEERRRRAQQRIEKIRTELQR
jgi:hypothetical protein